MIHKAMCTKCIKNSTVMCFPDHCEAYQEHKKIMTGRFNMKCRNCHSTMVRKNVGNSFYYECPKCFNTFGKPKPVEIQVQEVNGDNNNAVSK